MYRDVQIQYPTLKYLYYIMSFIITIKKKNPDVNTSMILY